MSHRDEILITLREEAFGTVDTQTSVEENFQNKTLRPILKLQNDLFIKIFVNHLSAYKNDFYNYSIQKKLQWIENTIQKDIKLKNLLIGVAIGQFTIKEYSEYANNYSSLNKRMMNMIIERLKSQIQIFVETDKIGKL